MITYRAAGPDDAATLDRIFDTSFRDAFAHLYREQDLEAFLSDATIAGWEAELGNSVYAFRVAEADGTPVGYAKLGPLKLPIQPERPALSLHQLYILKEHHGTGIARVLMDWVVDEARSRGARELYLTVYIDNHRARSLYDRYGFEIVAKYDFVVGTHVDEDVIMRKLL